MIHRCTATINNSNTTALKWMEGLLVPEQTNALPQVIKLLHQMCLWLLWTQHWLLWYWIISGSIAREQEVLYRIEYIVYLIYSRRGERRRTESNGSSALTSNKNWFFCQLSKEVQPAFCYCCIPLCKMSTLVDTKQIHGSDRAESAMSGRRKYWQEVFYGAVSQRKRTDFDRPTLGRGGGVPSLMAATSSGG